MLSVSIIGETSYRFLFFVPKACEWVGGTDEVWLDCLDAVVFECVGEIFHLQNQLPFTPTLVAIRFDLAVSECSRICICLTS